MKTKKEIEAKKQIILNDPDISKKVKEINNRKYMSVQEREKEIHNVVWDSVGLVEYFTDDDGLWNEACFDEFNELKFKVSNKETKEFIKFVDSGYRTYDTEREQKHPKPPFIDDDFDEEYLENVLENDIVDMIFAKHIDWDLITEKLSSYFMEHNNIYTTRNDEQSEMWIYQDGIYIPQGKTYISEFAQKYLKEKLTPQICNKIIFKIEVLTYINQEDFFENRNIELVPVLNGILDIKKQKLMKFNPKYIFFNKLNINYDPDINNDVFEKFFEEIIYKTDIPVIQELFGYCLYRNYPIHKSFMFNGGGRNGKGTTLNLLENFVNVNNITDLTLTDMEQDNFTLCRLHNKMVNISGDIDGAYIEHSGTFKKITGSDTITAKRKFKTDINFKNYAKMIFACNELPKFRDNSDGQWARWILIDFPFKFVSPQEYAKLDVMDAISNNIKEMDINKVKNLTTPTNMSSMLNWALAGLHRILKVGSFSVGNSVNVREEWKAKNNSVIKFVNENCFMHYQAEVMVMDFKSAYSKFCKINGLKTEQSKIINKTLEIEFGIYPNRKNIGIYFDGINLNNFKE